MERPQDLRNSTEKNEYPNTKTMELFLEIWYKMNLFETVERKLKDGKKEKIYKNANAIATLALISDYLNMPWKESQKESFINELEDDDNDFYKKMWNMALDIWEWKWNLSEFSEELIQSNREKIKKSESNIRCFPTILSKVLPSRYPETNPNRIIHEKFEKKLEIQKRADKIQEETAEHKTLKSWGDPEDVAYLKAQL